MGINHRYLYARMAKKFLNCPDIAAAFEKMSRKAMAKRMNSDAFGYVRTLHRLPECFFQYRREEMMPPDNL